MAKKGMELPFGALHMLVTQATPMAVEAGEVYRVLDAKCNQQTGQTQAKLVGPIKLPAGIDEALARLLTWHQWIRNPSEPANANPYNGNGYALAEDVTRVKMWREAMKGGKSIAETGESA